MGRVSAAAPLDRVAPSEIPLTPERRFARTPGMRDQSTREAMAEHTLRATTDALLHAVLDARSVELELLDGLTDSQMLGTPRHFVEPPIWEMGHVGWFQERSEEHTSELQSLAYLVCRLLLEKKKILTQTQH